MIDFLFGIVIGSCLGTCGVFAYAALEGWRRSPTRVLSRKHNEAKSRWGRCDCFICEVTKETKGK